MEAPITPTEVPRKTITPEEGRDLGRKAFKRVEIRDFKTFLLDQITDPIQPRSYRSPASDPFDLGQRRLHPVLFSALVCFGLLFAAFLSFTYWR